VDLIWALHSEVADLQSPAAVTGISKPQATCEGTTVHRPCRRLVLISGETATAGFPHMRQGAQAGAHASAHHDKGCNYAQCSEFR
jgi:hypothetical protein